MKIRQGITSEECVENKWFNMKYIGKYLNVEILLTRECSWYYRFIHYHYMKATNRTATLIKIL